MKLNANHTYTGNKILLNKLEQSYVLFLHELQKQNKVLRYIFEGITLKIAHRCTYTPDFYVVRYDGLVELHEVKGRWEDDARVKIKAAAELYPEFIFRGVTRSNNQWCFELISPTIPPALYASMPNESNLSNYDDSLFC